MSESSRAPDPSRDESHIFFDWDDTLLCSNILKLHRYTLETPLTEMAPTIVADFKRLGDQVIDTLQMAQRLGQVAIITAATEGWVQDSAKVFLGTAVVEELKKVKIISATSTYSAAYPNSTGAMWKYLAMRSLLPFTASLKASDSDIQNKKYSVISCGDSDDERTAVKTLGSVVPGVTYKSMKFVPGPVTVDVIIRQLKLLKEILPWLVASKGDLDLQFTPETGDKPAT